MALTEEHKAKRVGKITSSIAAAALGLSERMSPLQAALAARGELDFDGSKATERGNALEDIILEQPSEKHGWRREPAPFVAHPVHHWAGDSADALYYDGDSLEAVGEGKSAGLGVAEEYGDEGTDEIPNSTLIQSHWHLAHWPAAPICVVPVLVGGYAFEFREYVVRRDDELMAQIFETLGGWHQRYVIGDELPPASASDTGWLTNRFPSAGADFVADTPEIEHWARRKEEIAAQIKPLEKEGEEAKNRLRQLLGEAKGCKAGWGKVTWTNNKPKAMVNWQAIADELCGGEIPTELIEAHTTIKPGSRVLRVRVKR